MAGKSRNLKQVAVAWFKVTDLRVHDHEALLEAHKTGLPVLHLFVIDPRWYKKTPICGFPRTGPLRARFQLEALEDLAARLQAAGHSLCIRKGKSTKAVFEELCNDFHVSGVFASREVCSEELRVERAVQDVLRSHGMGPLHRFWTFELAHYDDLPEWLRTRGSNSYTGYKQVFHDECRPRKPLPVPQFSRTAPAVWDKAESLPKDISFCGVEEMSPDPRAEFHWKGGETAALARVRMYLFETDALALDYVGSTNTPREGNSCTKKGAMSRLSPWLAHGNISARMLYSEIKRYERERHKSSSTYWLVHEMYWRDFVRFQSFLVGDRIFKIGGIYNKHPDFKWYNDRPMLDSWIQGQTGFPFLDAAMREVGATGYSCHVGRETSAWFLICDLGLDWRMGAEWFESILIDYEPAANWFCWVFVCLIRATGGNGFREIGCPEIPPRTRLQTVEVVFLSAQHDPDGEYIKLWIPELKDQPPGLLTREPWREISEPVAAVGKRGKSDYQEPGPDRIQMARRTLTKGGGSVAVWWPCVRNKAIPDNSKDARQLDKWPKGYPLPLFPPSSFFDIEKVAEKARWQQNQKAKRVARLKQELGPPQASKGSACVVCIEETHSSSDTDDVPDRNLQNGKSKGKGKNSREGKSGRWQSAAHQSVSYYGQRGPESSEPAAAEMQTRKRRWGRENKEMETEYPCETQCKVLGA